MKYVASTCFLAVTFFGAQSRAQDTNEQQTACSDEEILEVETASGRAPLRRHCEEMKARAEDGERTYGELMYEHSWKRGNLGMVFLALFTPVLVASSIGLGIAANRARIENDRRREEEVNYWSLDLDEDLFYWGSVLAGVAAGAAVIGGIALIYRGVCGMRLYEPLLKSNSDTSKKNSRDKMLAVAPLVDSKGGGLTLSVSF
jgi:hypothetical protein